MTSGADLENGEVIFDQCRQPHRGLIVGRMGLIDEIGSSRYDGRDNSCAWRAGVVDHLVMIELDARLYDHQTLGQTPEDLCCKGVAWASRLPRAGLVTARFRSKVSGHHSGVAAELVHLVGSRLDQHRLPACLRLPQGRLDYNRMSGANGVDADAVPALVLADKSRSAFMTLLG